MASTVSYANIAANGTVPKNENSASESEQASVSLSASSSSLETGNTPASEQAQPASAEEPTPEPAKKEKKVLAPAPVPSKSAWGSAPSSVADSTAVDEHKWPTPDKVIGMQQTQSAANKAASKFIKPNKWVPINAKVVLPSPRSSQYLGHAGSGNQQKNKKKNKPTKKKTSAFSPGDDSTVRRDGKPSENGDQSHIEGEALRENTEGEQTDSTDASGDHLHYNYNYHQNGQKPSQNQKGFRKYNQNVTSQSGRAGPQSQQNRTQNEYYQPFASQYHNFNGANRQYKPAGENGFRRNSSNGNIQNGNYTANGFRPMGLPYASHIPHHPQAIMVQGVPYGAPMPVYIPPPISPKQDPLQALTQQIDYYFSLDNLIRDVFLRKNMGTEGWVDLDLILNFKRVKIIVNGIQNSIEETDEQKKMLLLDEAILKAVQRCQNLEIGYLNGKDDITATATEVQLRVKNNFEQWLLSDM